MPPKRKGERWGDEEVSKLIAVWSDDEIQKQLDGASCLATVTTSASQEIQRGLITV